MKVTVPVTDVCKEEKAPHSERLYVSYGYSNSFYFDYRKLNEIITELLEVQEEFKDKYDSLEFRKQHNCGCWGSCSCDASIVLYGTRDENEVERKVRLHNLKIDTKNQEKRDRREYKALKEKFEKS